MMAIITPSLSSASQEGRDGAVATAMVMLAPLAWYSD
jgi:hypothetical protein